MKKMYICNDKPKLWLRPRVDWNQSHPWLTDNKKQSTIINPSTEFSRKTQK